MCVAATTVIAMFSACIRSCNITNRFRFVRDYMRYKDDIQCAGTELVNMARTPAP